MVGYYTVMVYGDGSKYWYLNGKLHREDGPAIEHSGGYKCWLKNGLPYNREDGPTEITYKGKKLWYDKKWQLHREDGPAKICADGREYWYKNGKKHRKNGPAIIYPDGREFYYINGKELTKEEFNARINSCNGKVIEIDGKKYKLQEI